MLMELILEYIHRTFENEFISLTDNLRVIKSDEPKDVNQKLDEKQGYNRISWFMGKTT